MKDEIKIRGNEHFVKCTAYTTEAGENFPVALVVLKTDRWGVVS